VYNYDGGPCYRCLYPAPPPPETVTNCSDGGVLGVVPGIIGSIQALEVIKIAARIPGTSYSKRLLLFDALEATFRSIRLRGRQPHCAVCGDNPSITELIDYEQFCGGRATDKSGNIVLLTQSERISVTNYKVVLDTNVTHVLLDVRLPVEMEICQLPNKNTVNIPIADLNKETSLVKLRTIIQEIQADNQNSKSLPIYTVCRRGNDSQTAVKVLQEKLQCDDVTICDIKGGLLQWTKQINPDFPVY